MPAQPYGRTAISDDLVERLARFLCNCWGDVWSDGKRFHVANAKVIMDMVAPEITRLRAELVEAEARGYRRGVEEARATIRTLDNGGSDGDY